MNWWCWCVHLSDESVLEVLDTLQIDLADLRRSKMGCEGIIEWSNQRREWNCVVVDHYWQNFDCSHCSVPERNKCRMDRFDRFLTSSYSSLLDRDIWSHKWTLTTKFYEWCSNCSSYFISDNTWCVNRFGIICLFLFEWSPKIHSFAHRTTSRKPYLDFDTIESLIASSHLSSNNFDRLDALKPN